MMRIDLIQYIRPSGRPSSVHTEVSDDLKGAYEEIQRAGWRLEAEVLLTGEVALSVHNPEGGPDAQGEDVAVELCPNGPEVQNALRRLIKRAANYAAMPQDVSDDEPVSADE